MCFRKNNVSQLRNKDRALIDEMDRIFDVILAKVDDSQITAAIKTTKGSIRYLVPSSDRKVISLDETLKNKIDDLRAEVIKEKINSGQIIEVLKDINVSVSQRNSRA